MKSVNFNATEAELLERIRQGDSRAFKVIFDRYFPSLLATARYHLHDENTCENIVQDIFLNLWLRRESLNIKDFKSYLKSAARYQVYSVIRSRKLTKNLIFTDEQLENHAVHELNNGEEWFHVAALKLQINSCLQMLPKRCREIFMMSREEHLSNLEIAERLNISKRTVENQITVALHHLRVSVKNDLPGNASGIVSVLLLISSGLR